MSSINPKQEESSQMEEEGDFEEDELEDLEEDEEEIEEEINDDEDGPEGSDDDATVGRRSGRGLTLKTLLKANILEPGIGQMSINYLGNKFKGDLLPDGRIRSQETSKIFSTPSAWAIYCKKIVNPDKKSGCGWASVRYRGKKLDAYKNNWYRQKRLEYEREAEKEAEENDDETSVSDSDAGCMQETQEVVEFETLGTRHSSHDMNMMVELTSFQSLGRMQPFNVTMSSSATAVIEMHSHLTSSEVVGYLAGQWDVNNHNLIVSHAMPVLCNLGDAEKGSNVEQKIYDEMRKLNLTLVGWYHTHPFSAPLPTLRDIDSQLEHEMKLKGFNDASYTPCIAIIASPYQREVDNPTSTSKMNCFWVMPPPDHKPQEYGRPMSIQFNTVQDAFIPREALVYMRNCVVHYLDAADSIIFTDTFMENITFWDKLKGSLHSRVPSDHIIPLLEFVAKLLDINMPHEQLIEIKREIENKDDVKAEIESKVKDEKAADEPMPEEKIEEKVEKIEIENVEPPKDAADDVEMKVPSAPQIQALAEVHMQPMETSPAPEEKKPPPTTQFNLESLLPYSLFGANESKPTEKPAAPEETFASILKNLGRNIPLPTEDQYNAAGKNLIFDKTEPPSEQKLPQSKLQSALEEDSLNKLQSLLNKPKLPPPYMPEQQSKLHAMLQDTPCSPAIHHEPKSHSSSIASSLQEPHTSKLQSLLKDQHEALSMQPQHSGSLQSYFQEQQTNALQNLLKEQKAYMEEKNSQSLLTDSKLQSKYSMSVLESKLQSESSESKYPNVSKLQNILQEKYSKEQREGLYTQRDHLQSSREHLLSQLESHQAQRDLLQNADMSQRIPSSFPQFALSAEDHAKQQQMMAAAAAAAATQDEDAYQKLAMHYNKFL